MPDTQGKLLLRRAYGIWDIFRDLLRFLGLFGNILGLFIELFTPRLDISIIKLESHSFMKASETWRSINPTSSTYTTRSSPYSVTPSPMGAGFLLHMSLRVPPCRDISAEEFINLLQVGVSWHCSVDFLWRTLWEAVRLKHRRFNDLIKSKFRNLLKIKNLFSYYTDAIARTVPYCWRW